MNIINHYTLLCLFILLVVGNCTANSQGNFTTSDITTIQNIILSAEDYVPHTDLNGMAQYINDYLSRLFKKCWNVYVFDQNSKDGTFAAHITNEKSLKWFNFGKYKYTYLIFFDTSSYDGIKSGNTTSQGISFGKDINSTLQQFIIQLTNQTIIYKGDDLNLNAQFIRSKLYPGNWNVIINNGANKYAGFQCRKGETWSRFDKFGRFMWDYYFVRTY